jgi:hypothetical protein
MKGIDVHRTI